MAEASVDRELRALGLTPADRDILLLVPAIRVAWADGSADPGELETLADAHFRASGDTDGIQAHLSEPGRKWLNHRLLYSRPDGELLKTLEDIAIAWVESIQAWNDSQAVRADIIALAVRVAESSGGFGGLFNRVSRAEREALQSLGRRLKLHEVPAGRKLLDALSG